jgi:NAD(P)-dependent dehydrogenase (short-subunit alcohol dehydrogenase family)
MSSSFESRAGLAGARIVVTGGSSGMGAAVVETLLGLSAQVDVLDIREGSTSATYHQVDLRDPSSIDAVINVMPVRIDGLVNCAGMPQTFPYSDVIACNVLGLRHLTESLMPRMPRGSAVVNVSSIAGRLWRQAFETTTELLATPDMDSGIAWVVEHPDLGDPYIWSKMAVNAYTVTRAPHLAKAGLRMNAVCPGNTKTAMTADFVTAAGQEALDALSSVAGAAATPQQIADVIVFLVSDFSSYMNGALVDVDGGFAAAVESKRLARSPA